MSARRDYADLWRDAWATLAQVPVAGLLAANYFSQQWVERTSTFLSELSTQISLARPAALADSGQGENLMADVLSEGVIDSTGTLVRSLVSLPGESALYFNQRLGEMVREVLERVRPDAQTDPQTYVSEQLEGLLPELARLRHIARTEATRQAAAGGGGPAPAGSLREPERASLEKLLRAIQAIAGQALMDSTPGSSRREPEATPRETMLQVIHAIVSKALQEFPPAGPREPARRDDGRRSAEAAMRMLVAAQKMLEELRRTEEKLKDDLEASSRRQPRPDVRPT